MRFVHMADVHLDSPFRVLALKKDLADKRRLEQREAFKRGIEYVKKENIPFLFIAGDLYEQEYIKESTIEYINNLFKEVPNTKIFIAPGNHDPFLKNSFYNTFNWNENVTIFDGQIKRIELDEADIYGFGFTDFYCTNSHVDEIEIKNKEKINILITHGSLDASKTLEMQYNPINSSKLKTLGFDYVALGHIHKANYNENENNIIYPGSLISFGFDELGDHGILDVEINYKKTEKNNINLNSSELKNNYLNNNLNKNELNNNYLENKNNYLINNLNNKKIIEKKYIKIENNIFEEKNIDIKNENSEEEIVEKIKQENFESEKFYKVILKGSKNIEINPKTICKLLDQKNILKVKDKTEINLEIDKLVTQKNLKGMFVKNIMDQIKNNPDEKNKYEEALKIGLKMFE